MSEIAGRKPETRKDIFRLILDEDREAIQALLQSGFDPETKDGFGATPVLAAAQIDDWITVELMVENGARIDVADVRGLSLPYLAATSRVDRSRSYGQALERVIAVLAAKGAMERLYAPEDVRTLQADKRWPPPGLFK